MSIHRLPNELIEQIVDNIAPDMHLPFALTCKRHLFCSQSMLAHHRQCVTEHKEITDVFDDFSRPADPVAAWHNREFVAYRPFTIVDALQIPTLRSLEVRTFHDRFGRGDFDPSKLPTEFRTSITELYLNGVEDISTAQLEAIIPCFEELKVLRVENCTFDTGNMLMELVAKFHSKTMEVIHYGNKQSLCGAPEYSAPRLYDIQHLSRFTNLRHLVVELPDILYGGFKSQSTIHDTLCVVFPPSLKYLKILLTLTYRNSWERPVPGKLDILDDAIAGLLREKAASGSFCLERLNLAWSEMEWNTEVLTPSGGHYVNWFFPNFGGHHVATAVRARCRYYPFYYRAIEAGHDAKIVVETFHHAKSLCKRCGALS
jgi:hypothetical protein